MLSQPLKFFASLSLVALSACATLPTGPSVMVLPAQGKPFDLFRQEDAYCRYWAEQQIRFSPQSAADRETANGAIAGTAIGAGLGALIGSASGHAGNGALIGGLSGLLLGAAAGANSGHLYGYEAQQRYDSAYLQCMYANGNQIPVRGRVTRQSYPGDFSPPPPPNARSPFSEAIPPPPPGAVPQTPPEFLDNRQGRPY